MLRKEAYPFMKKRWFIFKRVSYDDYILNRKQMQTASVNMYATFVGYYFL